MRGINGVALTRRADPFMSKRVVYNAKLKSEAWYLNADLTKVKPSNFSKSSNFRLYSVQFYYV